MTTLKGIFPSTKTTRQKNFIRENVQNLRRMEQYFQLNKDAEEIHKTQVKKQLKISEKYHNIAPRVHSTSDKTKMERKLYCSKTEEHKIVPRKTSAPILPNKLTQKVHSNDNSKSRSMRKIDRSKSTLNKKAEERLYKTTSDSNLRHNKDIEENLTDHRIVNYKSQSIQTLDESDMKDLYSTGIIRYPSTKNMKGDETNKTKSDCKNEKENCNEDKKLPADRGDQNQHRTSSSTINKQRQTVANKLAEQLNNGAPPNYRKGVVPKYLKERKEILQKEQKAKAEMCYQEGPEGHILLPDEERKETLRMLKKSYQEYVTELNKLPIRNDTLRAQKRKMEIEKQLNKLEEGIKVFSRPKVFVKIDS